MTDNTAGATANAPDAAEHTPPRAASPAPAVWLMVAVAVAFALAYGYFEWDAIRNVIQLPGTYDLLGVSRDLLPWPVLIVSMAAPVVVYLIALIAGRRRSIARRVLFFALGLTTLSCLMLSIYALA